MRPPKNKWPDTPRARGTLFFAQQMAEMLSSGSFESFRALSLDILARLKEAINVIDDVQEDRVPSIALEPVLKELIWSIESDTAIKTICPDEAKVVCEALSSQKINVRSLRQHVVFLRERISGTYKSILENEILDSFQDPNSRIKQRNATSSWCSHILNVGYSRDFILEYLQDTFFSQDMIRPGSATLRKFFARFDSEKRKYTVYVPVNGPLAKHLRNLQLLVERGITSLPSHAQKDLSAETLKHPDEFLAAHMDALDPFSVSISTQKVLRHIVSIALIANQGADFEWDERTYVSPRRSSYGRFYQKVDLLHGPTRRTASGGRTLKSVREHSNKILYGFHEQSVPKLLRAIDTAISSYSSSESESRLIAHWSAVEVLLSNPDPHGPRIVYYVDILSPSICLKYPRRLVSALFKELAVSYRGSFGKIVSECSINGPYDQQTAFAALLLMPEFEKQRQKLMHLARRNPLALHRLWKFVKDFGTPSSFRASVTAHEMRIRWQLHRICRARNGIVHSGYSPPFIDSLVLNIVEYFGSSVLALIGRVQNGERKSNIEQMFAEMGIEYRVSSKRLLDGQKADTWGKEALIEVIGP